MKQCQPTHPSKYSMPQLLPRTPRNAWHTWLWYTGQNGEHGIPGLPGQAGEQGPRGDSGNSGEKGIQGEKGEIGITGAKGKKGEPGFPGELGPAGPVGQKGSHGPPGVGVPGAIGPKGEQGEVGQIGMPGSPGPVGSAPVQRRCAFTEIGTNGYIKLSTSNLIIKLNLVELNIGSNYNVSTGVFTSTIPGVYFFSYSYHIRGGDFGIVQLRKNGKNIVTSYVKPSQYGQFGQAASLYYNKTVASFAKNKMNLNAIKLLLCLLSGDILLQSPAVLGQLVANDTDANQHIQANLPCCSCCPGLPGMPGMPGYGIPGQNGEHGIPGLPGQTGEQGPKGDSGNSGEKGIQGEKGEIGIIGAKGNKGEPGFPGKLGPAGPVGQKGSLGPPGVSVPGLTGPKGERGEAGPIGMPGSPGPVCSSPVQRRSAFTVVQSKGVIQPSTGDLIIKLDTVELNIGSNYNESTGVFTCTITGVYFFSYSYLINGDYYGLVQLKKNGKVIVSSYEKPSVQQFGQSGQVATIQLQINDEVWLQFDHITSRKIYSDKNRYTSFTGFLLYETMNLSATKLFLWLLIGNILLQFPVVLGQPVANDTDANQHIQANVPCHSCCPGHPGTPGTPGYGIPGQNGEHGIPGLPGQTGEQGPKGTSGNSGEKGIQGEKGEIGIIGAKGKKGESGFPGKLGPAGPVGQKGSHGSPGVGVPGAIGLKGKKGETGPIGMPGSPGPVGSAPVQRRSAFTVVDTRNTFEVPYSDLKIKLNSVKLNIGSNYDTSTGVFTCTIPGVYFFSYSYHIHEKSVGKIELRKNDQTIVESYEESSNYGQAGQTATLQLQINDKVWIQFATASSSQNNIYSHQEHTSFTGFLIYEI
ncbi:uncharacterized protein LOC117105832 [Anneissia japonica]|uniref:uncharacterized protein LOC117105832 n=1 Tax=Anneissia japonica TaxID=1529436 RepID=UPI00142587D0|nr:uncharacterized protein LOC117105832 [Anneissia japonica]